jgi:hypothetical protein
MFLAVIACGYVARDVVMNPAGEAA